MPKILAFAGSLRKDSFNKKLIKIAVEGAKRAGAEVTLIDLKDFQMPVYDADIEAQGFPDSVKKLKEIFNAHQGFLMSCPEYNSSITGVLKNTIDWLSRPLPGEVSLLQFKGKAAGLVSASPGALGGLRGLVHVRSILGNIGVLVIPNQMAVSKVNEGMNPDGTLKDAKTKDAVERVGQDLAELLKKLHT